MEELSEKLLVSNSRLKNSKILINLRGLKSFIFTAMNIEIRFEKVILNLNLRSYEKLGENWRKLVIKKEKYNALHKQDKERYEDEMEDYENKVSE